METGSKSSDQKNAVKQISSKKRIINKKCKNPGCKSKAKQNFDHCLEHVKKCSIEGCDQPAPLIATKTDVWGEPGLRCRAHLRYCSERGCEDLAAPVLGFHTNVFKPHCEKHSRHFRCYIPRCSKPGTHAVSNTIAVKYSRYTCAHHFKILKCTAAGCERLGRFGKKEKRCEEHIIDDGDIEVIESVRKAQAKLELECNLSGCSSKAVKSIRVSDKRGGAGPRCKDHESVCTANNCWTRGHMKLHEADEFGPSGMRCKKHGVKCNVIGCEKTGQQVFDADEMAPKGFRCKKHGTRCNASGCGRTGTHKCPSDEFGPTGLRCALHTTGKKKKN
jgi:hypothetical protein